jgi:hypothetical protein
MPENQGGTVTPFELLVKCKNLEACIVSFASAGMDAAFDVAEHSAWDEGF